MNLEELLGRYLLAAADHYEANKALGSRSALRRGNRAADELRALATEIGSCGPAAVREFSNMLNDPRNGVSSWAAFHLLEVMTAPPDIVNRALDTLEALAQGDGVSALGIRMRLKELRLKRSASDK